MAFLRNVTQDHETSAGNRVTIPKHSLAISQKEHSLYSIISTVRVNLQSF